ACKQRLRKNEPMSDLFPYGLVELPWWGYVAVTFATIQIMFLGVTLYLHRDQSHGGLILHPVLRHCFRFWLWYSSGAVTKEWVAVHRRHHAYADQPGDPHSPVVFGVKRVLFEGYELYNVAAKDPAILKNYGKGTPKDWIERNLYSRFPNLGVVLFSATALVLFGIPAIVMVAVHLSAQPFFAGGVVNGLGHAVGYRSFEMPSTATNLLPWGLLLGGEELHNNHHAFPRSARFAVQRWEFDIGWMWVCIFRALRLAKVRYVAPRPHLERRRNELDADTVHALFTNRMHVLRDYARRVVLPVCRELARREPQGSVPAITPKLLIRHPTLLAAEGNRVLHELLERYEVLRRVVEYRDGLQHLWNDASANQARAVGQLREWCTRAEASGIRALREFSQGLPAYAPAGARSR
ncbi:MAG: aminotransferase, partial [Gammaproteobacteria bacterium]|nr:aminotransferase [Gammaproteobacteria bacterium]